jgi:hypothetical protein
MLYVPYKEGQEEWIHKLLVDVFSLVLPEKVAEEVVKRDVKLTFDPVTKELVHVQMPFESKTEVMFLTLDKGWVTEASVEDVKLLPGVRRTIFRLGAGEWVSREMVREVQTGGPGSWSIRGTLCGGASRGSRFRIARSGSG